MKVETKVDIDATADRVWAVMSDVERWPEWTASMTSIELLDGEFALGKTARIKQPRLPASTWRVSALNVGQGFTWETRSLGTHTIAGHLVEPRNGGSRHPHGAHDRWPDAAACPDDVALRQAIYGDGSRRVEDAL